ncbi:putative glycoside hydrolase [Amycolatopsis kentuckyensis]|uniref:putative glycoside hydrolase n=1 Tax=Amycolatopsis kentuckyensis TaxID=218823 RepID=UPI000A39E9A6|nr:putative glycoside hydrolase [Amycolatopsis kentuckyensis]
MTDLYLVATAAGLRDVYLDSAAATESAKAAGGVVAMVPITADYRPSPTPVVQTTRSFWVHYNSVVKPGDTAILDDVAKRRLYVLMNTWDNWMTAELKKRNPALKCFVYKDLSSTRSYDTNPVDLLPAGVRYADAPDAWFLKDSSGRRIEYSGYPGHWLMDVGNASYQQAWAASVLASVVKYGFDGVLMDNALWTRTAYGAATAKYATDAAFQQAYQSMLAAIKAKFADSGKLLLANLTDARVAAGRWESYLQYLDGAFDEWWLTFSDTNLLSEYDAGWSRVVGEIEKAEAAGKICLVQPHCTQRGAWLYAWASYLMVAGTKAAIAEMGQTDGYGLPTPWHPEYDWNLGAPLGPRESAGTNLWRRRFANGVAIVNCNRTGSAAVNVQLGWTYRDSSGNAVTAITLAGTSGIVLKSS